MAKSNKYSAVVAAIGDRLSEVLKSYSRINQENLIYDPEAKTLNPAKLMPIKDLRRYLETVGMGDSAGSSSSNIFERFFGTTTDRSSRYAEYEQIVQRIPEAARALQIYTDSILAPNLGTRENQFQYINKASDRICKEARKVFQSILDRTHFEEILPQIIYTTLLYGDCFLEIDSTVNGFRYIIRSPKNCTLLYDAKTDIELGLIVQSDTGDSKILEMLSISYPNLKVPASNNTVAIVSDKAYMSDDRNKEQVASVELQIQELLDDVFRDYEAQYRYLTPNKYIKFSIYYNNNYYPYGTSILDSVRAIAKQLLLVEAALSVYRVTRTPLRSLWTVEVGNTPEDQIAPLLNGVQNRVRRQHIIGNTAETTIDTIPDIMGFEEDIWTPSIGGNPILKMEQLPPPDISSFTNDADYFRKKLLSALGIPPSYLAEEQGSSTKALLTLEDVNYSRTVKKYQNDINHGLKDFVETCFLLIKKPHYAKTFLMKLPVPKTIEDTMRVENLSQRLGVAGDFMSNFENVPKLWIMKNIVGMSDDDLRDMSDDQKEQADYIIFMEQSWNDGSESEGGGDYARGGGGFSSFGDNMSDDFGEDLDMTENDMQMESPLGPVDTESLNNVDLGTETPTENV